MMQSQATSNHSNAVGFWFSVELENILLTNTLVIEEMNNYEGHVADDSFKIVSLGKFVR